MVSDKIAKQQEDVQFRTLHFLKKKPDASQREIAKELGISLGAVVRRQNVWH